MTHRKFASSSIAFLTLVCLLYICVLFVTPAFAGSDTVVISEFRTRGPQGGNDEFIELYNLSSSPVAIGGWKINGSNSSGTTGTRVTIAAGTVLNPGCHFLATNTASSGYSGSVTGDQSYATGVTDDGGIALLNASSVIIDQVGLSTTSAYKEGTVLSIRLTTNTNRSYERKPGGALGNGQDTDNNASDYTLLDGTSGTPNPQNMASACIGQEQGITAAGTVNPTSVDQGGTVVFVVAVTPSSTTGVSVTANLTSIGGADNAPLYDDGTHGDAIAADLNFTLNYTLPGGVASGPKTIVASAVDGQGHTATANINLSVNAQQLTIMQIQGSGTRSPYEGQAVKTTGVVTAVKSNGFFLQDLDGDGDPTTSDGLLVFTSSAPTVAKGDLVNVQGNVQEFASSSDPAAAPQTELSGSPIVAKISSGNPLPNPVVITAADINPDGAFDQLEKYEGMRVHVDTLNVVAPTGGFKSEANATATTNGVFFGTLPGLPRPFRGAGIEQPAPVPNPPCCIPTWNSEPQRIRVDSRGQSSSTAIDVATGAVVGDLTGPLDFGQHAYTILTDTAPTILAPGSDAIPVPTPDLSKEFTVANFNMERFYDSTNDAGGDAVLTPTAYANRLKKASLAIRNVMNMPDIIGVEEMENLSTIQTLAAQINSDAVAGGAQDPQYQGFLAEGNDPGGIDVGFLVKTSRVQVNSVVQYNKDSTYTDPTDGQQAMLNDRPPLVLDASVTNEKETTKFIVIVNHLRSLTGIDGSDGLRIRAKRRAQAEELANLIQGFQTGDPTANIVSVGDYNAFDVNDGYVDMMGTIKGTPTAPENVLLASPDLVDPDLTDLLTLLPAEQQYSYINFGSAQTLDHILVNQGMMPKLSRFAIARNDADFPEVYRSDANRPERLSDHDMPVAYFNLPVDKTPPVLTLPADFTVEATSPSGAVVTYTVSALDSNDGATSVLCNPASGSTFPLGVNTVSCTTEDARHNSTTGEFKVSVVDTTPPVVTVTGVTDGADYTLGSVPAAGCSTTDTVSAISTYATLSITGGTANGVGTFTATCSGAQDAAGNLAAPVSVSYTVSYAWSGFLAPVNGIGPYKAGSTLPLKWMLKNGQGGNGGNLSSITSLQIAYNGDCAGVADGEPFDPGTPGASSLMYDSTTGLFHFNWQTKGVAPGCYSILLGFDDGKTQNTVVKLR
ncbi:MAG TPA: PxKF domain-containing protein [Terriglobales bacterium]|nr:PxKF domain-containing protein [Terriglobales bacterium]